jgi:hypothetical protein
MRVIIDDRIVHLSPEMVAKEFWNMDGNEQVEFFNALGNIVPIHKLPFQLQFVTDSPKLTNKAREIMNTIGQYSEQEGVI